MPAQQVATVNDDASKKSATNGKSEANGKSKSQTTGKAAKPVVVTDAKKPGQATKRPAPLRSRLGPQNARSSQAGSTISGIHTPRPPRKVHALQTITVGRVGKDPAQVSSLTDALARLPAEGGVIELRGPGPFLLPSQRINKRRQVIFTGISPHEGPVRAKNAAGDARPMIVIVPPPSLAAAASKVPSGIVANETSLTFYGVDLVAFADAFRSNNPLHLIDVHSGDLIVQNCAVTLIGTRTAPTIAFSISSAGPAPVDGRAPRLLLDRTVVRGSELGAIAADCQSLDFLAINSLLVTGQTPILTLTASSTFTPPSPPPAATANANPGRMLRFFSCTGCSGQSAVSIRANADSSEPPATEFLILNSTFGVSAQTQFPMVLLANWPPLPESSENSARFKKLSWKSQSFVARGWQDLVGSASGIGLHVRDAENWGRFWGDPHSSVEYQSSPFPTIGDIAAVAPPHFKSEGLLLHDAGDTLPPGCDAALLAVSSPDMVRRADAFSHRLPAISELDEEAAGGPSVREIDLDNPKKADLAKSINSADWPSGTRFLVHGTKKKMCSPIRVANRSLSIEFDKGLVLAFDDRKADPSDDRNAFITVTGGSIEIVNATMRIESSTKSATHRLLDVRGGKFSIRNCNLLGPRHDYPGYEELIRFSSSQDESIPAGEGEALTGSVRNSFLLSPRNLFTGDLSARNLVLSNSLLVSGGRLFNVRLPSGPSSSVLDLRSCTLSAGGEYFHFNTKSADGASNPARVFVENSLFAPPVRRTDGSSSRAALIGSATGESFRERVDWWEYANAYSSLIQLPGSSQCNPSPMLPWTRWRAGSTLPAPRTSCGRSGGPARSCSRATCRRSKRSSPRSFDSSPRLWRPPGPTPARRWEPNSTRSRRPAERRDARHQNQSRPRNRCPKTAAAASSRWPTHPPVSRGFAFAARVQSLPQIRWKAGLGYTL